ncbi:MAG: helix-turn-helix domain-containing protein, partial [Myxococcota bacterium]
FLPEAVALRIEAATVGGTPFVYDETFVFSSADVDHNVFVAFVLELCASSGITNQALLQASTRTLEKMTFEEVADLMSPVAKAHGGAVDRRAILTALVDAASAKTTSRKPNAKLASSVRLLDAVQDDGDRRAIIAKTLLSKYAEELASPVRGFSPAAIAAIKKHDWPGNIRQLQNKIKKALVLCDSKLLSPDDLDLGATAITSILPLEKAKEDFQRRYVLEALERNGGNRTQTARDLGVDPRTIFRYLEKESKLG